MSLLGLLCLLLAIVATLLFVLYMMQRRELLGISELTRQIGRVLEHAGPRPAASTCRPTNPNCRSSRPGREPADRAPPQLGERPPVASGPKLFTELADPHPRDRDRPPQR